MTLRRSLPHIAYAVRVTPDELAGVLERARVGTIDGARYEWDAVWPVLRARWPAERSALIHDEIVARLLQRESPTRWHYVFRKLEQYARATTDRERASLWSRIESASIAPIGPPVAVGDADATDAEE